MPVWSIDQLLYVAIPPEVLLQMFDVTMVRNVFLSMLIVTLSYPLVHKALTFYFKTSYKEITSAPKQLVVLQHSVEALFLAIMLPVFSYKIVPLNFQVQDNLEDFIADLRTVGTLMILIMFIYMIELASRYLDPRPLIIFHHLVSIGDALLILFFPTSVMMKTGVILVYFICFEFLTFAGLVMYRLFPLNRATPKVIIAGMVVFGITRPAQLLWVFGAVFWSWNDENTVKWQAVVQIIATFTVTSVQIYSLKIHYSVWKRCIKKQKGKGQQTEHNTPQVHICSGTFDEENDDSMGMFPISPSDTLHNTF
jgi:hypothetical protein